MTNDEVIERLREWPFMGKAMATAAADRLEERIAERDAAWKRAAHAEEMWGRAEVKLSESEALLAKALEGLRHYAQEGDDGGWLANDILAELTSSEAANGEAKGGKDE